MSAHPRLTRGTCPALRFLCPILTAFHKKPSRWTWASWIVPQLCQCTKSSSHLESYILSLTVTLDLTEWFEGGKLFGSALDILGQGCGNHSNKYAVEVSLGFENSVYHVNRCTSPYPREMFLTIVLGKSHFRC